MPQMTAVQIRSPGGPFEVVKREIPDPGPNQRKYFDRVRLMWAQAANTV
jgi:hypothetical protein